MTNAAYTVNLTATSDAHAATTTYVAQYKTINPKELVSYADKHQGEMVKITGTIFGIDTSSGIVLVALSTYDLVALKLDTNFEISGIYKDDYVTVYGTVNGYLPLIREPELIDVKIVKS